MPAASRPGIHLTIVRCERWEAQDSKGNNEESHPSQQRRSEPGPGISIPRNLAGACLEGNACLPGTSRKSGSTHGRVAAETALHRRRYQGAHFVTHANAAPVPFRFCELVRSRALSCMSLEDSGSFGFVLDCSPTCQRPSVIAYFGWPCLS